MSIKTTIINVDIEVADIIRDSTGEIETYIMEETKEFTSDGVYFIETRYTPYKGPTEDVDTDYYIILKVEAFYVDYKTEPETEVSLVHTETFQTMEEFYRERGPVQDKIRCPLCGEPLSDWRGKLKRHIRLCH